MSPSETYSPVTVEPTKGPRTIVRLRLKYEAALCSTCAGMEHICSTWRLHPVPSSSPSVLRMPPFAVTRDCSTARVCDSCWL